MYADHDLENNPSLMEPGFSGLLQAYNNRQPIEIPGFACKGQCEFDIVAPGFDVRCGNWTSPYRLMTAEEYERKARANESVNDTPRDLQTMFWSKITYDANNLWPTLNEYQGGPSLKVTDRDNYTFTPPVFFQNSLVFSSMWKSTPTVEGQLKWRYCVMQEAVQRYPVIVMNSTVKIQPRDLNKNLTEYWVLREEETSAQGDWMCTIGGLWLAIRNAFAGSAQVRQTGLIYSIITNTSSPLPYIHAPEAWMMNQADVQWKDPIDDMINMLQELSLRTAIHNTYRMPSVAAMAKTHQPGPKHLTWTNPNIISPARVAHVNRTLTQNVSVYMTIDETVYVSHRGWMLGAFAAMALAFFGILPLFASWAELGRDVSLNPIETARAFDAPLLRDSDPNGTASELVAGRLGGLRVRYGAAQPKTGEQDSLTYEGTKAMLATGEVHEVSEEGFDAQTIAVRSPKYGREASRWGDFQPCARGESRVVCEN